MDYESGYVILLSEDWLPLPADADAIKELAEKVSKTNPEMADMLKGFQAINNESFRLIAVNQNREYRDNGMLTNLIIFAFKDKLMSAMPLDFLVEMSVEQLKANVSIAKVLTYGTDTN